MTSWRGAGPWGWSMTVQWDPFISTQTWLKPRQRRRTKNVFAEGSKSPSLHHVKMTTTLPRPLFPQAPTALSNYQLQHLTQGLNLNCFVTNVRSIVNKVTDFNLFVDTFDPDLVALTETWLHADFPNSLFVNTDKYCVFRKDRCTRGGGVCILIKRMRKLIAT